MKYIFVENGKLNGCGECLQLTDGVQNIEVSESLYNAFAQDPDKYIYLDGEIVENPEYEILRQKKIMQKRMDEIKLELEDLDTKRIRAVCEDEIKNEKPEKLGWIIIIHKFMICVLNIKA